MDQEGISDITLKLILKMQYRTKKFKNRRQARKDYIPKDIRPVMPITHLDI
jgi:hypothetical protein